ncbi:ThuA domain-containing protein [Luteolibacter algae]|uniref:ThuA domain-containing protein n=1 Tax=Luteolibacter algae TaxID=454151 RepID=A0ABW5DB88_9BACT
MKNCFYIGAAFGMAVGISQAEVKMEAGDGILKFTGGEGPGKGKQVVLLAGDEEYRSEESMPMLARILTEHHGFDTTVLFSVSEDGTIDPTATDSLAMSESLDSADALVMLLRFRNWDDETMKKFNATVNRGIPIVALRTSTHIFNFPKDSPWAEWSWNHESGGFGRKVLGETWVSHWGKHKLEATRGVVEKGQEKNPVLNGVVDVFGDSDVYEAAPPEDATVLLRGVVLKSMEPNSEPADYEKKLKAGGKQKVNEPAMPVAWTREVKNEAGTTNKVLTTTMGAATDLQNEGLRRLVVNGVFDGLGMEVPAKANVDIVGEFQGSKYGFGDFQKGKKAGDFAK